MLNHQTLTAEIKNFESLRDLIETYKVVAATTMRRIRNSVLQNRFFHLGLNSLLQEVRRAYQKEAHRVREDKKTKSSAPFPLIKKHNGKTVLVLLSANTGLYGEIIYQTFWRFLREARQHLNYDLVIVGKVGESFFKKNEPDRPYLYFDFSDAEISVVSLRSLTGRLSLYERVVVFYGAFKNIMIQQPSSFDISASGQDLPVAETTENPSYLFEPSLEAVAVFFETEIFASLLEQLFHESRLGKTSSRLVSLDRSSVNIEKAFKNMRIEQDKLRHRLYNRRQLDALSGVSLWSQSLVTSNQ